MKKKIVIVGGGFAGSAAIDHLLQYTESVSITLIDRYRDTHYIPLIPEIISKTIPSVNLLSSRSKYGHFPNYTFINDTVIHIAPEESSIKTLYHKIKYDYLIIAAGSETNFYGNDEIRNHAFTLDTVFEAEKLLSALLRNSSDTYLVAGGGYTGVEIASHLKKFCIQYNVSKKIFIIERGSDVVPSLPNWIKEYVKNNLTSMGIEIMTDTSVKEISADNTVILSNGITFSNALLIWTAGMKAATCVDTLSLARGPQQRLRVSSDLRIFENIFAAGNVSCYQTREGRFSRMAAQFSLTQGRHAARNVIHHIHQKSLLPYALHDWGYLIPMANWCSCGTLCNIAVQDSFATFLHYLIHSYRSYSLANKIAVITKGLRNKIPFP